MRFTKNVIYIKELKYRDVEMNLKSQSSFMKMS